MCVVSIDKKALNITICNQYPDLELTSPSHFSTAKTCHVSPSQQTDDGNMIEASFRIYSWQYHCKGALLYKLQKKYAIKADNQPNDSTTSVENTATNMYLMVAWNVACTRRFGVCLIECTNDFTWDANRLCALCKKYYSQLYTYYKPNTITWSMHNGTAMKIRSDITYEPDYKLDIVISEATVNYNTKELMKIYPKRSVLSLSMLIVLIYTVSLLITPAVKLNIHNQCLNIDLVSPMYDTSCGAECYKPLNYKACARDIDGSIFMIGLDDEYNGVLIYELQRRQSHTSTEIGKDTLNVIRLLVVWSVKYMKLYADVLLVEHDKVFNWNEDNFKKLYRKNINQFRLFSGSATETWSLDDNVVLMTTFEPINESFILNIAISEVERNNGTRTLVYIDSER
jgi:hypothetical protein